MDGKMDQVFDLEPSIPFGSADAAPKLTMPDKILSCGSLFGLENDRNAAMLDKISSLGSLFGLENDHNVVEKLNDCFFQEDIFNNFNKINTYWNKVSDLPENTDAPKSAFFPSKLHHLLEDAEKLNFEHIVSWTDQGRAFHIHDQKEFVEKIMNNYFDQSKFASFRRQLNLYGFRRRRSCNNTGNEYYHENFIKANRALCHKMLRKCGTKNSCTG